VRMFKFLGVIAGLPVAACVLLFGAAVVVNRHDAAPSADYLHLERLIANRPPLGDAQNGYVYLLGIRAPADVDPRYLGERRLTWFETLDHDMSRLNDDPGENGITFRNARAHDIGALADDCDSADWRKCQATFASIPDAARWNPTDLLLTARYRELIHYPAWREHVGNDIRQPIAGFADAIWGQRLLFLAMRRADAQTLRDMLSRDHAFWRTVLGSSDTLLTKMIAVSALRQHYRFGNLLLRACSPAVMDSTIPDGWRRPLTREELSLESVLAGEIVQLKSLWRDPASNEFEKTSRVPFYQPQDVANEMAADYRSVAAAFDVPLSEYLRVERQLLARPMNHVFPSRLYDAGGYFLRSKVRASYEKYALRVAAVEAWRRAALITTQLRARGIPPERLPAELAAAALRNPFDGSSFVWSDADHAVVYEGTEDQPAARRRQVYVY